jgi:hypothetical protein
MAKTKSGSGESPHPCQSLISKYPLQEGAETMKEHLHLIREQEPSDKPYYKKFKVWCPHCKAWLTVIHLDLPPENPKEVKP